MRRPVRESRAVLAVSWHYSAKSEVLAQHLAVPLALIAQHVALAARFGAVALVSPDYSRGADILVCLASRARLRDSGRLESLPHVFMNNPGELPAMLAPNEISGVVRNAWRRTFSPQNNPWGP
jgi:hypothetical protein